ncbi:L-arabinitol 4-dehydrogenase [Leucosporidium creatinivorum]|uniref:L-arabinitol 4-dehydrogenase n=1 Tax=Leucosporidium creatinivorum TaxID=106004 RepID=A0A1Y2DRL0_9BASI|nr:L-arabinitol 4-dehydrogenase [Leucosporidium creatinivorum]
MATNYPAAYDPVAVLQHPDFKILEKGVVPSYDPTKNLATAYAPGANLYLIEKPYPKAREGEVVVHVRATGICGSETSAQANPSLVQHGRIGDTMVVRDTCGAGHESAGEIHEVGPGVEGLKKGDRVVMEAGIPCGQCEFCRIGRYNACPTYVSILPRRLLLDPPYHGMLTRYHLHPASWVHRIPESISFEEGALLEPLAVALAGIERAGLRLGDPLLICGAGPIGLVSLLAARAAGAAPIVITDIAQSRLDFAKKLVPGVKTILVERGVEPKDVAAKIKAEAGLPLGLSVALECTGVETSVQTAIFAAKFGSTVFVIGVGKDYQSLPFMHMSANEIDLKLQYRYCNQYSKAIRLVEAGYIDLKPLVTHRFTLETAIEAFETAADVASGAIKCQILDKAL